MVGAADEALDGAAARRQGHSHWLQGILQPAVPQLAIGPCAPAVQLYFCTVCSMCLCDPLLLGTVHLLRWVAP
jgi:hypothetical protein